MIRQQTPISKERKFPYFVNALKLKCLYCASTNLRSPGSWFTFQQGCKACNYRFERELGYYTAASWLVTFPIVSCAAFLLAAFLMWQYPGIRSLYIAGISSIIMLILGLILTPYCMAIWMYCEHRIHPLNKDDSYNKELVN